MVIFGTKVVGTQADDPLSFSPKSDSVVYSEGLSVAKDRERRAPRAASRPFVSFVSAITTAGAVWQAASLSAPHLTALLLVLAAPVPAHAQPDRGPIACGSTVSGVCLPVASTRPHGVAQPSISA